MSYNINLQHIVFRTGHSHPTIPEESKRLMLAYIHSLSNNLGVKIKRINAYLNHVHILAEIPVTMLLPDYVRKIKSTSSHAFRGHPKFPMFCGWAVGYGSFSVSHYEKDKIVNYIMNQEKHHKYKTFAEELKELFGDDFISCDPHWIHNWED